MEYIQGFYENFITYALVFFRVMGVLVIAPLFSSKNILVYIKMGLAILISFFIVPNMPGSFFVPINTSQFEIIILIISEFLIGLLIGYVAHLLFDAISFAGQIIDMQMGFGIVNVVDPQTGVQMPVMGTFKYFLTMFFYLAINGHLFLIQSIFKSYELLPIGEVNLSGTLYKYLLFLTSNLFIIGLKIALPYLGALFTTDFILGIIARTVPQMNVFLIGMPIKIVLGFLLVIMIVPVYVYMLDAFFEDSFRDVLNLIKVMS